jgi:acyl-CoA oxidase
MSSKSLQRPGMSALWSELVALFDDVTFNASEDSSVEAAQRRTYEQLDRLNAWAGTGSELLRDRNRLFTALEFVAIVNPSLFHVAQVHYGVCLASVRELGQPSARLDALVGELDRLDSVGVILITELGTGNSHLATETRAVHDLETDEFILSTPSDAARKFMPNVALQGVAKTGMVFAQLWSGDRYCGVFPFIVPIRSREQITPGIRIKPLPGNSAMGMDYAVVSFDGVRVPRTNWLGETATLSRDGAFHDPLADHDRRLIRSLGVSRNASTSAAVGAAAVARACTWTALKYASQRTTMGRLGAGRRVLDFHNQRGLLFGALAQTVAITLLANQLVIGAEPSGVRVAATSLMSSPWSAVNRVAALVKAVAVGDAQQAIQRCRSASGAQGSLAANRFREFEDLVITYASAGGDNHLILLDLGREMAGEVSRLTACTVLPVELNSVESLLQLAQFAEHRQYERASRGLPEAMSRGDEPLAIWNPRSLATIDLARAHGQRLAIEGLLKAAQAAADDAEALRALATIHALNSFGALLPYELTDPTLSTALETVAQHLDQILDGFGLSPEIVRAPMAGHDYRSSWTTQTPATGSRAD